MRSIIGFDQVMPSIYQRQKTTWLTGQFVTVEADVEAAAASPDRLQDILVGQQKHSLAKLCRDGELLTAASAGTDSLVSRGATASTPVIHKKS